MENTLLKIELCDLCERYGVTLDAIKGDEVLTLAECCSRIVSVYSDVRQLLADCPVARVYGVPFYDITPCAAAWLDGRVLKWWPNSHVVYFWALVYASTHAHDFGAFSKLDTPVAALRSLFKTSLRFLLVHNEVIEAVERAVGIKGRSEGWKSIVRKDWHKEWQQFVERLESVSGIRRKDWLWGESAKFAARAYQDVRRFTRLCFSEERKAQMLDDMDVAMVALAMLKKSIKDRLEKEAAANG